MRHPTAEGLPIPPYPGERHARDEWILSRRPARLTADPTRPHACFTEDERSESGEIVRIVTLFLTNRECPWHCLMCDLWKNTLAETVTEGAIPAQIDRGLDQLSLAHRTGQPLPTQIKLYNSGSFFDPLAIPPADHPAIASRVCGFTRVIVECHPSFVRRSCLDFRDLLVQAALRIRNAAGAMPTMEVAMGLETAHPEVLLRLNKGLTLDQFARAAEFLRCHGIALRVFVLVKPPFLDEDLALEWAQRSILFAFDVGATVVSLIPTRAGNGALEALQAQGQFSPPKLSTLEAAHAYGIGLRRGRVFADTWDLAKFSDCPQCFAVRRERLLRMNLEQEFAPILHCPACGYGR